jgi:hypothetical protein
MGKNGIRAPEWEIFLNDSGAGKILAPNRRYAAGWYDLGRRTVVVPLCITLARRGRAWLQFAAGALSQVFLIILVGLFALFEFCDAGL